MILDPSQVAATDVYRFLISTVVPRPIAFVSTLSAEGRRNLAPFSFFNAISNQPPLVGVTFTDRPDDPKDSLRNIRATSEFVINIVTEALLEAMTRTAGEWPAAVDEFEVAGLTATPSLRVKPPRVKESPVHLECKLYREIALGSSVFVVGEVVMAEADDALLTDGRIDPMKLRPVGRLGGEMYSLMREVATQPRPRVSRTG